MRTRRYTGSPVVGSGTSASGIQNAPDGFLSLVALMMLLISCSGLVATTRALGAVGHEYVSQLTQTSLSETLAAPAALAIDSDGNVWVADPGKGVVDEFDSSGNFSRQITGEHFGEGGKKIYSIAVAPLSKDIYVADSANDVIDVFSPAGAFLESWSGTGTPQGNFIKEGITGAQLGVAIDMSNGDVYVASTYYHVIDRFNSTGKYQSQIQGVKNGVKNMVATGGVLHVVAPPINGGNVVEEFDSLGNPGISLGHNFDFEPNGGIGSGDPGIAGTISSGIAVDSSGHLYVVNSRRKVVNEFSSSGEYLGQIDGSGTPIHHLIDPGGVAVNSSGKVYLADFNPLRQNAAEGTGVVDVFGSGVEQRTLAVSVTGGASVWLGGGENSSVLSLPAGVEERWGCKDPVSSLRPPFVGPCGGFNPSQVTGCEWECSIQFAPGTDVILSESPGKGFKFKGWLNGCSGKESKCEVKVDVDSEVGAEFEPAPKFLLKVNFEGSGSGSVTGSGVECPSTCSQESFEGEKVKLKAEPDSGSEFGKWVGCEVEVGPGKTECEVTITKAVEVAAEFVEVPQRTLSVVEVGTGGGLVVSDDSEPKIKCPLVCSNIFNTGKEITLKAEPDPTSRFVKWEGCEAEPSIIECKITLTVNTEIKAEFEAIPQVVLMVSVSGVGSGVVSSEPFGIDCGVLCSHSYNEGAVVRLMAQPTNATSVFLGWSGGGCAGTGACEVTLDADLEVTATFGTTPRPPCANEQLRAEQLFGGGLPDCRGYEMVSPVDKNGNDADVNPVFYDRAAVSGGAVTFESKGSFSGPSGAPFNSQYLSRRGVGGWVTRNISPPTSPSFTQPILSQWTGMDFTADLSKGLVVNGDPPLTGDAPAGFENLYVSDIAGGSYEFVAATQGEPYQFEENVVQPGGASADLSHVVFEKNGEVFGWANGQVSPVSNGPGHTGSGRDTRFFDGMWHAVSADGSRVFFTRRESGEEGQLFVRVNESSTVQVSASQRAVADPHGPRPALFWGASVDGSRVFFTSTAELTDDANTGSADNAPNLYEYDLESGVLTDLTVDHNVADVDGAGVGGVLAMSEDGSYVYFVAGGVLAPGAVAGGNNLYLWHGGVTSFIATLGGSDGSDWVEGLGKNTSTVTPGGRLLAFQSKASLTGYDNHDVGTGALDEEVFLYDSVAGKLVCASCNASGARPVGSSSLYPHFNNKGEGFLYKPHNFSDDGKRLFFQSVDALVSGDSNGLTDVYEFEAGFVSLISNGSGSFNSFLQDVGASGDDVFFATANRLVSQDQDGLVDLYDARVGGGFPAVAVALPGCNSGELCRPPGSSPPAGMFGMPVSSTVSGVGNLAPSVAPVVIKKVPKRVVLSRAQLLAKALKACKKKPRGRARAACERSARKRYGPVKGARKAKAKSVGGSLRGRGDRS